MQSNPNRVKHTYYGCPFGCCASDKSRLDGFKFRWNANNSKRVTLRTHRIGR